VLKPLGISETACGSYVEFGALILAARDVQAPQHIAFIAESRDQVGAFHRAGVDAGYQDNGAPSSRAYAADYYAAFLLDPDGHNIEAIHRTEPRRRVPVGLGSAEASSPTDPHWAGCAVPTMAA
jgi:hypothetical protein